MIYFCQKKDEAGLIKIGTSKNFNNRRYGLRTSYGDVELIGAMTGSYAEEKELHTRFKHLQVVIGEGLEWFAPAADLLEFIKSNAQDFSLVAPLEKDSQITSIAVSEATNAYLKQVSLFLGLQTGRKWTYDEIIREAVKAEYGEQIEAARQAIREVMNKHLKN